MDNIKIKNIEYLYSKTTISICSALYEDEELLDYITVTFDIGRIKNCKLNVNIDELNIISEFDIKRYILNHIDIILERKYIDEI